MTNQIRHVSFDLWGTLIQSDVRHASTRNDTILHFLNKYSLCPEPMKIELLKMKMSSVKKQIDIIMDNTGMQYSQYACFNSLLLSLGVRPERIDMELLERFGSMLEEVFYQHPPLLMDGVKDTLSALHGMGITMSILSNTSFISGAMLKERIIALGISSCFRQMIFSDQEGKSKPHRDMFEKVVLSVQTKCYPNEILHVGDNPVTDGAASRYGLRSLIINHTSSESTIEDVFFLVKEGNHAPNFSKKHVC